MFHPKNNFPVYASGYDPEKTIISVDLHGKGKGAQSRKHDIYLGPRIGSYGPDWVYDIPLSPNHHFVLEYFFYMPSPGPRARTSICSSGIMSRRSPLPRESSIYLRHRRN